MAYPYIKKASGDVDPDPLVPWTRNSQWLSLPSVISSDQRIVMLVAVYPNTTNDIYFSCAGTDVAVDWGDGVTETNSTAIKQHSYSFSDTDLDGSLTDFGYKQAIISITCTNNITSFSFDIATANIPKQPGVLDMIISLPNTPGNDINLSSNTSSTIKLTTVERIRILNSSNSRTATTAHYCNGYRALEVFETHSTFFSGTTDVTSMFDGCNSLQSIQLYNLSSATTVVNMFNGCTKLHTVSIDNISAATTLPQSIFSGCARLNTVTINNSSGCQTYTSLFSSRALLRNVTMGNMTGALNLTTMFNGCSALRNVSLTNTGSVTSVNNMFALCTSLKVAPTFTTSACTDFTSMFSGCSSLTTVPLYNTAAGITFTGMFNNCTSLQGIPLFDTSSGQSFNLMFSGSGITTIPLLVTSAGTNFQQMFSTCRFLTSVPLLNTASATNLSLMFNACESLTTVPTFNTASATNMSSMFASCRKLQTLPTFTTTSCTNFNGIVSGCTSLVEIPAWNMSASTSVTSINGSTTAPHPFRRFRPTGSTRGINVSYCNLDATALDELYTNLGTASGAQTITVTGNWGTNADTPSIATGKGYTVTG